MHFVPYEKRFFKIFSQESIQDILQYVSSFLFQTELKQQLKWLGAEGENDSPQISHPA